MTTPEPSAIETLLRIMAQLRDPETGCPWDVEQTFETIAPYTLEEAYEVEHAIRTGDMEGLCDELGDLLLQVVFHAQMADEAGLFSFDDVATAISDKLVRRHPHVFGDPEQGGERVAFDTPDDFTRFWEESKARERAARAEARPDEVGDPFEGIPTALPALARAAKIRKRAARHTPAPVVSSESPVDMSALDDALAELVHRTRAGPASDAQAVVGELLQRCVDAARALDVDPEDALHSANFAFEARVREASAT